MSEIDSSDYGSRQTRTVKTEDSTWILWPGECLTSVPMTRSTPEPRYLYVVEIGEYVKVGISSNVERRCRKHAADARKFGLHYEPLMFLEPHLEAQENERAVVREFRGTTKGTEYLEADSVDVLRFVSELPTTVVSPAQWLRLRKELMPHQACVFRHVCSDAANQGDAL